MSESGQTARTSDKPRWSRLWPDEPKWVMEAVAFNLAMGWNEDDEEKALNAMQREIDTVRRMYSSPRSASPLQLAARKKNREA